MTVTAQTMPDETPALQSCVSTTYVDILQNLLEDYGLQYEGLTSASKHFLVCAFSWAITDMMEGESPEDAWSEALDEHGDELPSGFEFEELEGDELKAMILVQFETVTSQLKNSLPA